jgi:hypothetical protein
MKLFRPHTLSFTTGGTPPGQDADGLPTEGTPGVTVTMPCRFHLGGSKVFRNQDSTESLQIGRIRIDDGLELPSVGQEITVTDNRDSGVVFNGPVKQVYPASLSSRIEV